MQTGQAQKKEIYLRPFVWLTELEEIAIISQTYFCATNEGV